MKSDFFNPGLWLLAMVMLIVAPFLIARNAIWGKPVDPADNMFADLDWDEDLEE